MSSNVTSRDGRGGRCRPQRVCFYYCKELLVQQCSHQIMIPWAIMSFGSGSSFYQLIGHGKALSLTAVNST
ncbi:unnamed protein product [Musa hybrid cultivar]